MDKLKLDLDALVVESFDAETAARARGTVRGNDDDQSGDITCHTCVSLCPDPMYGSACVEPSCREVC